MSIYKNEELSKIQEELNVVRKKYWNKFKELYNQEVTNIFISYPTLESFSMRVSNHEFNDGDATRFYVNSDDPELSFINGYENGYKVDEELNEAITDDIYDLYGYITSDDLETLYGDEYDSVEIYRHDYIKDNNG